MSKVELKAEVIAVYPNKVVVQVDNLSEYNTVNTHLTIGSYLQISDNSNVRLLAIIENFSIQLDQKNNKIYLIEAFPLGLFKDDEFVRGGDTIAIPPKKVEPAHQEDIVKMYESIITEKNKFCFSTLTTDHDVSVSIDGNKFFNKHIAVVGSTGSGKSHTVATIIQKAIAEKKNESFELNNSHVIIFDIHGEYQSAFPDGNLISIENLILPYWLLNSDEIEEILLDTGERDNYNQASVFRNLVTENKKKYNPGKTKISYDTPVKYNIKEIENALINIRDETKNSKAPGRYMIDFDGSQKSDTNLESGTKWTEEERILHYFEKIYKFYPVKNSNVTRGNYADGTLEKFVARFQSKLTDARLDFMFSSHVEDIAFIDVLKNLLGYGENPNNVTVIDLSGIPFEALSITVSLISRLVFEYGYYLKRKLDSTSTSDGEIPFLLVYEEAHKYVPKSDLSKYRSSLQAIERIAKEGRKYGISLLLASQRPSEISETIFAQCNNFVAMRLTNPNDQSYVKKLLPDALGALIDKLPSLKAGEALIVGDSISIPSVVQVDQCLSPPSSNDIPFLERWKEEWAEIEFLDLEMLWTEK